VLVETRAGTDGDEGQLAARAEHLIKAYVGVTTRVRVVAPGTIERSQGKAKRVIDLRPKQT
jgi:phenylacetate-CoA ligase